MNEYKEIFHFNFSRTMKNVWIWLAVLGSAVFVYIFGLSSLVSERGGLSYVVGFNHVNMLFPLVVLGYTLWFVNEISHSKVSELLDVYPYQNWRMFLGIFTSQLLAFWIFALLQFFLVYAGAMVHADFLGQLGLDGILWVLFFTFSNVFLLVALASLVAIVIKEVLIGYIVVFVYHVFNLLFDKFMPKYIQWFGMIHLSAFKYDGYSDFGVLANERNMFIVNRLGIFAFGLFLIALATLLFKAYRGKRGRGKLWMALGSTAILLILSFLVFGMVNNQPAKTIARKIEQARFREIPLKISQYNIVGMHSDKRLDLQAEFLVTNPGNESAGLAFYLTEKFLVEKLLCQGEPLNFKREGDLLIADMTVKPREGVLCFLEYGGEILEYAKEQDNFWDYKHTLYAYAGPELLFVPACAGWYPRPQPIYNYVPALEWIYPARVPNKTDFSLQMEGEYPIVADQNVLYGYPGLKLTVLDGIEYYHLDKHKYSIKNFHEEVSDRLLFLQELVPLQRVQVFELPNTVFFGDFALENGGGRVFFKEESIIDTEVYKDIHSFHLDRKIFTTWFNLDNLGFDQYIPGSSEYNFLLEILPVISGGSRDAEVLYAFFKYLFRAENGSFLDAQDQKAYLENLLWNMRDYKARVYALELLVEHYEEKGLAAARQIFQYAFLEEQNNALNWLDLIDFVEGVKNHVP